MPEVRSAHGGAWRRAPAALVLMASACASGERAAPPPDTAGEDGGFIRDVSPFEVLDPDGEPYDHPFFGGFTVPRPQFVDMDGDGTLDLFVQERGNELMHFENVGTPEKPRFEWRTDRWKDLEIGDWARFVDLDGDGRVDLLAEEPYSHIRVYLNEGTPREPRLILVEDSLRDDRGQPIFADRQNIPAFHDLDGDGRMDLFLGRIEGTVSHYESVGSPEEEPLPRFRLVADRFEGIEIIGTVVQPTMLHGANSMFFADADGNGLKDLYWGDFFEAGLLLMENRGTPSNPRINNQPSPVRAGGEPIATSGYNAPFFADLFDRGVPDLFIGVLGGAHNPRHTIADNLHHYRNTGDGGFEPVTTRFIYGIDVGQESTPALGDLTGNGQVDLVVGNRADQGVGTTASVTWFENVGEPGEPRYRHRGPLELEEGYSLAPEVAPLWSDELPGLVVGNFSGEILFFRNVGEDGEPRFELQEELSLELGRGTHSAPALADLNGNGLLDLVVGRSNGRLAKFRNVGSANEPAFELVSDEWLEVDVGRRSHPTFADLADNGLPDLLVGSSGGGSTVFRNVGEEEAPVFEEDPSLEILLHPNGAPAVGDLTGDGRAEVLAGGASGGLIYFRRP